MQYFEVVVTNENGLNRFSFQDYREALTFAEERVEIMDETLETVRRFSTGTNVHDTLKEVFDNTRVTVFKVALPPAGSWTTTAVAVVK